MEDEKMRIALIAHDKKKEEMIEFAKKNESILKKVELVSTGTTGLKVMENTDLKIYRYKSGPLGGDQQIGALVADHNIDMSRARSPAHTTSQSCHFYVPFPRQMHCPGAPVRTGPPGL